MTARLYIGDVFDRMAELEPGSYDVIITSPPFLALRSYLPDGHPDKAKEIGSEATPAAFLDVMLALTAEWGRLLAPHGSIAIEIGDTYSGSGGAGGDYNDEGLRAGQQRFRQQPPNKAERFNADGTVRTSAAARSQMLPVNGGDGWPLAKSLAMIPELYAASLAYGRNLLTGETSPAGRWRVRNFKPWIRSNPPVGALGDKERPATSYITVATRAVDRYFDLDAVRASPSPATNRRTAKGVEQVDRSGKSADRGGNWSSLPEQGESAGAPPLDWVVDVDLIIDDEIDTRAGRTTGAIGSTTRPDTALAGRIDERDSKPRYTDGAGNVGARGVHIRRRLEQAGILTTFDALDISPRGYAGAHYAVWPPELVKRLLLEMAPRRVCTVCGKPSRRITETPTELRERHAEFASTLREARAGVGMSQADVDALFGFNGMCSHWERKINGPKSQPAYPTPEQWAALRQALAIDTGEFDGLIEGYRRWKDRDLDPEYRAAIERTRSEGFYASTGNDGKARVGVNGKSITSGHRTVGWSDCGCPGDNRWRPARILDPFAGSGTTLAVATGLGFDADGIDLDPRNADLARERCGMFLEITEAGQIPGQLTLDHALP